MKWENMSFMSWGLYPKLSNTVFKFDSNESLKKLIADNDKIIPCGNGRSYGDSALNEKIINVKPHNYFIDFDSKSGLLHVQAGVLLSEILESFVPRGWFLKVTPGTKLITVAGAIASDVHGKNHHIDGCFSESLKEFEVMLAEGEVVTCSKEKTPELFRSSCGGQGLTGVILSAKIYLKKIESQYIDQLTIKTNNLLETFQVFEKYNQVQYSVAWIDCLATGENIGRCILMVGNFSNDGDLNYIVKKTNNIPFFFPSFILNKWSVKIFNWLYYNKVKNTISKNKASIDSFFYPLDLINNWNRIYGKNGFVQYQFILPMEHSYDGLNEILTAIADAGKGSFLAVLKLYGESNENYLSFPLKGYSLALDFKIERGIFEFLNDLDKIVVKYGGRFYLAKDARVSKEVFEKGYPKIEIFRNFRKEHKMDNKYQSLQSKRIGI